jgi:hypothetical protein
MLTNARLTRTHLLPRQLPLKRKLRRRLILSKPLNLN